MEQPFGQFCIVANSEEGKWDMVAIDSAVDVVVRVAKLTADLRPTIIGLMIKEADMMTKN